MWKSESEKIVEKRAMYHCSTCDYEDPYEFPMQSHELTHEVESKEIESRSKNYWIHNIKEIDQAVKIAKYFYSDHTSTVSKPGWYDYDIDKKRFVPIECLIPKFKDELERAKLALEQLMELTNENSRDS